MINGGAFNLSGSDIRANTFGEGNGGELAINADLVNITDFSQIITETLGTGNAGNITIDVTNGGAFNLSGSFISTNNFGEGEAAEINIRAGSVDISDSFIFNDALEVGDAGSITIDVANSGAFNLSGSSISTNTFGEGEAGEITIGAGSVNIMDLSSIITETSGKGDAGDVKITTDSLTLNNGGRVLARTLGQGNAGSLNITASDTITIGGESQGIILSGLFANALESNGKGGNIEVFTYQLTINEGGTIEAGNFDSFEVFSPGTGEPGNINIQANSLSLNQAIINAATQSETGDGAKINIQLTEDLILSNNSLISALAKGGVGGGNIEINADFIIAFPSQPPEVGNDIVASAEEGSGGEININALSLFGIEERRAIGKDGMRLENGTNDIDASSRIDEGIVSINTPQVDPTSDLIELPEDVINATNQIAQNSCEQGVGSEFIVTGKGGLRPNPHGTLSSDRVQVALVEPIPSQQEDRESKSSEPTTLEAVPAQGWIFTDTGEVMLTSYIPSAMAEVVPTTPLAQAPTNPAQLATQAEKLYQNQEFDKAANLWSQAAQAFAASGDNLNQAMAWSNLALTYQKLGKWENINQAIQNSLTSLNTAPENSRLLAQTLDIQGKLQRETGQPAAAIETWQKAANIYQKLGESAALSQNSLNQAQAFQDLGLYSSACQNILASLEMENIATCQDLDSLSPEDLDIKLNKITAQPSLQKVWGLRKLGDLL